jgi:peptide/nickel transport system ATP-binding protein
MTPPDSSDVPRGGDEVTEDTADKDVVFRAEDIKKHFANSTGMLARLTSGREWVKAVDGISFELRRGETFGLAGESGCGKSTLGKVLMRIHEPTGTLYFNGKDVTHASGKDLRSLRQQVQFVFQDPQSSLNPRQKVGEMLAEPMEIHNTASGEEKERKVVELLETVGLSGDHRDRYPHEFSRGQQQRIGIARALAVEPEVLIADEPVSALDMSVQAKIINLLLKLQSEFDLTMLLIAHDLDVLRHVSDRIGIMYLGELVEVGPTEAIFEPPFHPYTEALLSSVPVQYPDQEKDRIVLEGTPPSPINPPSGCKFHDRCPRKIGEVCEDVVPDYSSPSDDASHTVQCHLFDNDQPGDRPDYNGEKPTDNSSGRRHFD